MPRFEKGPDGIVHQFPDDATDAEVAAALDSLQKPAAAPRHASPMEDAQTAMLDFGIGALKGAGHTVKTMADMGRKYLPGFADLDKAGHIQVGTTLEPTNMTQKVGRTAEQMAEWYGPGKLASKVATKALPSLALRVAALTTPKVAAVAAPLIAEGAAQGAMSVPMAVAHGDDPRVAAATGAIMPAAMTGAGALVRATANKVAPAALRRLMPDLAHHSEDFGDLTSFAREQQTPIGGSQIQSDLSKGQAKKVNYLLGLRDEARPVVMAPDVARARQSLGSATRRLGSVTPIGGASTRPTIAGYLPPPSPHRVDVPLGAAPVPRGGAAAVEDAERLLRRVEHPAVPGPDRSGVDALVQTQTQLGGAHPALPKARLGFTENEIRLAESLGEGTRPVPTSVLLGQGREAGTHFEPQFTGDIHGAGRPDVVAGPGTLLRMAPAPAGARWKPGQGAPAQMIDPGEVTSKGLAAARAKLANSPDAIGDLAKLDKLEAKFLASRQQPQTLVQSKESARMANNRAHNAYLATKKGTPTQEVPSIFNKAIGGQENAMVRVRAPETIRYDDLAQKHLGLSRVLYDAEQAAKEHNPLSAKPTSWITPRMMSKGVYKADTLASKTAAALASQQGGQRGILLARLLAQLGGGS